MESLKKRWHGVPATIRKPVVLIVGMLFVIAAPFTGVLPGPGGIPVFLIGVAILSTEYEWARRLRDWTLHWVRIGGQAWRQHKIIGTLIIIAAIALFMTISYFGFGYLKRHL